MRSITVLFTILLVCCQITVGGLSLQESNQALPGAEGGERDPVFGIQALGDIFYSFPAPGNRPWGLGWDGTDLWVSSEEDDTLYRLDPVTGAVLGSFPAPVTFPSGLTHDGQFLWLTTYDTPLTVYKIDPVTGGVVFSFPAPTTGSFADGLAHDGQFLWLSGFGDPLIYQMDPATGAVVSTIPAPGTWSRDLTWDGSSFWIADTNPGGAIFQISPVDGTVISSFVLPSVNFPVGLTFDGQNLFVSGLDDNTIYYVDLQLNPTLTVDSTADAVDAIPGDGVCATAGVVCTLRAAVQEANVLAGADTIDVPAGTYNLTLAGTGEDASATGDLDITDTLTINGAGAGSTIVDGQMLDRVFHVVGTTTATFQDLTVRNGAGVSQGGGIYIPNGTLTIADSSVINNTATGSGGGIASDGDLVVDNTLVDGNSSGSSGGIFLCNTTTTITDSTISNNTATNVGADAGGIWNECGTLTIQNSTLSGNTSNDQGGAINNEDVLNLYDSTISNNSAVDEGGGLYNDTGDASLVNVTISGNIAAEGGGIHNDDTLDLVNVTIVGNSASFDGGGISDFTSVTLKNTLLADNIGNNCSSSATFVSGGSNLSSDASCLFAGAGDMNSIDPLVGPLQNNGGPTLTHALPADSPAVDAGDNIGCPAADQRGTARPFDGDADTIAVCDIGAYEFDGAAAAAFGDCNGDGKMDAADLVAVLKNLGTSIAACDGDKDGTVEMEDVEFLVPLIVGE